MRRRLGQVLWALATFGLMMACGGAGGAGAGNWRAQGKVALEQGRLAVATHAFEQDAKTHPNDAEPHRWLAKTYERQGNFEQALSHWLAWLKAHPSDLVVWQKVGDLRFAMGQFLGAIHAYERVAASAYVAPVLVARLAESELQLRRDQSASDRLKKALAVHKDSPILHRVYGRALLALNQPGKAVKALQRAAELDPQDVSALFDMGRILEALSFPKRALLAYEKVLKRQPNHVQSLVRKGRMLIQLGEPVDALLPLQKAVRMQPDNVSTHNSLGVAFNAAGMRDEAANIYQKALALDNKQPALHANLAEALYGLGRFQKAVVHLRRALALDRSRTADQTALRRIVLMDEITKARCGQKETPLDSPALKKRLLKRWQREGWDPQLFRKHMAHVLSDREAMHLLQLAIENCAPPKPPR